MKIVCVKISEMVNLNLMWTHLKTLNMFMNVLKVITQEEL